MSAALPYDPQRLAHCAGEIIVNVRELSARGWTPATSSNFSRRIDERHAAITVSGRDKGRLTESDIMVVDLEGEPVATSHRPSAETLLHTQLYRWKPEIGAVLHTHSVNATVLSRLTLADSLVFADYELQKAFSGVSTHECQVLVPIFDNDQDIARLASQVQPWLDEHADCVGYLIRGHGLYTWGKTMADCLRQVEAFEFLFECELKVRALQR
jgi:methylthioribulose-1-phosphate dehydratase